MENHQPGRTVRSRWQWILLAALCVAGLAIWSLRVEPALLLHERVELPLGNQPLRLAHLSDLHVDRLDARLDRLVADVTASAPDAIVISGDLIADPATDRGDRNAAVRRAHAAATVMAKLRTVAPVFAVQGHSDHVGDEVAILAEVGVDWLDAEGRWLSTQKLPGAPAALLLGISQQAGYDELVPRPSPGFTLANQADGRVAVVRQPSGKRRNVYLTYDPPPAVAPGAFAPSAFAPGAVAPGGVATPTNPLDWTAVDLRLELNIDHRDTAIGVAVLSRTPQGEDRMVRFGRATLGGVPGAFDLVAVGSRSTAAPGSQLSTGVVPVPGRWYQIRVVTKSDATTTRVSAKVWEGNANDEPVGWQAELLDQTPTRARSGTVALWAWGDGVPAWRDVRVLANGSVSIVEPFDGRPSNSQLPLDWRDEPNTSRLALALAKTWSPSELDSDTSQGPRPAMGETPGLEWARRHGLPVVLLTHSPDVVLEAAAAEIDVVLAGHTHGGQVRIPLFGALTTRSFLGGHYDRGLFAFASAAPGGASWLLISPGVGTSLLPLRFASPPSWTLLELTPDAPGLIGVR